MPRVWWRMAKQWEDGHLDFWPLQPTKAMAEDDAREISLLGCQTFTLRIVDDRAEVVNMYRNGTLIDKGLVDYYLRRSAEIAEKYG